MMTRRVVSRQLRLHADALAGAIFLSLFAIPAFAFDPTNGDFSKDSALDVRIVAYNHNRSFIEDPSEDAVFERIFTALNPDIICFEEFSSSVSVSAVANRLDSILPIAGGGSWQIHFGLLGGIRTVIASRFPLGLTRIDTIPTSSTRGVTIALADLPDADYAKDVYLLGVHLKCCGNPGGSEDASRQDSADAMANWLGDARGVSRPSGDNVTLATDTPMIALGDFNMVGGPQPENTLLTGNIQDEGTYGPDVKGDWDNTDMTDLHPLDPDTGDDFTWQGNGSFPPGRLDRMFYTDSVMTVANSFILNTDTMTGSALTVAGLQAGDTLTGNSSDHLPIAMDLRLVTGPECGVDADCDDGTLCNGAETCDAGGACQPGADPCPGQACDGASDLCVDCLSNGDCDDGMSCNGIETCVSGSCLAGTPVVESCNGLDDDCDGATDNGFDVGDTCSVGVGECQAGGNKVCTVDETGTECDAVAGTPVVESCNGLDDDCDGATDNGLDVGDTCSVGVGECQAGGNKVCTLDETGTECDAVAGTPVVESCNGLDDDCDGATDNGFDVGDACSVGVGECQAGGNKVCTVDETGTECDAVAGTPEPELCIDSLDNDCDGLTDTADPDCGPGCPHTCGDVDGSGGNVNLVDFATFALCFGQSPGVSQGCTCSDLNVDGAINLVDFATFSLNFNAESTHTPPNCP